jgi:hypothetical protein
MLVRQTSCTPDLFVCPASGDEPLDADDYLRIYEIDEKPIIRNDFDAYDQCSYGYQVPYGVKGRPVAHRDPRMVLVADKGPFGKVIETGGDVTALAAALDALDAGALDTMPPEQWRKFNSPNHGGAGRGDGQNTLFTDTHVEFSNKPTVGIDGDNIYTRWRTADDPAVSNRAKGVVPGLGKKLGPFSDTDSLIYP